MSMYGNPHAHNQLRKAANSVKSQALEFLAEIKANPTELDEKIPVTSEDGPRTEDVSAYLDELEVREESVDFRVLGKYIRDRRQLQIDLRGVIYDPIDDEAMIPRFEQLVNFIDDDHRQKYAGQLEEIFGKAPSESRRRGIARRVLSRLLRGRET